MQLGLDMSLGSSCRPLQADEYDLPSSLPTPLLWYNVAKGGDGETLTDFGSLGFDLGQATASKQPALNATGLNGRPTLDFDGVDDCMFTASIDQTARQKSTELLVWYPNVSVAQGFVTCFGTNSIASGSHAVAQNVVLNDAVFVSARSTDGSPRNALYKAYSQDVRILAVVRDLTQTVRVDEVKVYKNGLLQTLAEFSGGEAGAGTFANSPLSVGAQGAHATASTFANMKLAENALFEGVLTDEQIATWSTSRQALYVA